MWRGCVSFCEERLCDFFVERLRDFFCGCMIFVMERLCDSFWSLHDFYLVERLHDFVVWRSCIWLICCMNFCVEILRSLIPSFFLEVA